MSRATAFIKRFREPLGRLLGAVRRVERRLGPEDDWVETVRQAVWRPADRLLRPLGRPTVYVKAKHDYITTAAADADTVEQALAEAGYQRNTLSTVKCRLLVEEEGLTRQWSVGQWVYDPADTDWQHDVYLFAAPDGRTDGGDSQGRGTVTDGSTTRAVDIYGHREASVRTPVAHHAGGQKWGDPTDRARTALARSSITYERRSFETTDKPYPKTMKHSKKKKSLIALGTALLPTAVTMLVKGRHVEGGALAVLAALCFVGYDLLDDKTKQSIAESVSVADAREAAEQVATAVEQVDEAVSKVNEAKANSGAVTDGTDSGSAGDGSAANTSQSGNEQ